MTKLLIGGKVWRKIKVNGKFIGFARLINGGKAELSLKSGMIIRFASLQKMKREIELWEVAK